jgi:hypothetical protein
MAELDKIQSHNVLAGFVISILLHLFQVLLALITPLSFWFIGVGQLVYIIPAIVIAKVKGETNIVKGLIIGASITFLLNAACTGLLLAAYSGSH